MKFKTLILVFVCFTTLFQFAGEAKAQSSTTSLPLNGDLLFAGFDAYNKGLYKEAAVIFATVAVHEQNSHAFLASGVCFYNGQGVEKDYKTAFNTFSKAVELKNPTAYFHIGRCYLYGDGCQKNVSMAVSYLERAAKHNVQGAKELLNKIQTIPDFSSIPPSSSTISFKSDDLFTAFDYYKKGLYTKAFPLFKHLVDSMNVSYANVGLGVCYLNGFGVAKNFVKAKDCFFYASLKGSISARYYLGVCRYYGYGVEKDLRLAAQSFEEAKDIIPEAKSLLDKIQAQIEADEARKIAEKEANMKIITETINGVSFKMIPVIGGTFQMGSNDSEADDDEKPVHSVRIDGYYIAETEVTQKLWKAIMEYNLSNFRGDDLPVENVSWIDIQEFLSKLKQLTGKNYRLPTEAEWEYAARGGSKSKGYKYCGSNNIDDVAWYTDNSGDKTHFVGSKQPNELGIYDMSGNVYEWCQDWYGDYRGGNLTNPTGDNSGSKRVLRRGSWFHNARLCRVPYRFSYNPEHFDSSTGFRLALSY